MMLKSATAAAFTLASYACQKRLRMGCSLREGGARSRLGTLAFTHLLDQLAGVDLVTVFLVERLDCLPERSGIRTRESHTRVLHLLLVALLACRCLGALPHHALFGGVQHDLLNVLRLGAQPALADHE